MYESQRGKASITARANASHIRSRRQSGMEAGGRAAVACNDKFLGSERVK